MNNPNGRGVPEGYVKVGLLRRCSVFVNKQAVRPLKIYRHKIISTKTVKASYVLSSDFADTIVRDKSG